MCGNITSTTAPSVAIHGVTKPQPKSRRTQDLQRRHYSAVVACELQERDEVGRRPFACAIGLRKYPSRRPGAIGIAKCGCSLSPAGQAFARQGPGDLRRASRSPVPRTPDRPSRRKNVSVTDVELSESSGLIDRVMASRCCIDMTFQSEIAEFVVTTVAVCTGGEGRRCRRMPFAHNRIASQ